MDVVVLALEEGVRLDVDFDVSVARRPALEARPALAARLARGDLACVFDWLRDNVWLAASRYTTDELTVRASGSVLDPAHFRAHLEARYLA